MGPFQLSCWAKTKVPMTVCSKVMQTCQVTEIFLRTCVAALDMSVAGEKAIIKHIHLT